MSVATRISLFAVGNSSSLCFPSRFLSFALLTHALSFFLPSSLARSLPLSLLPSFPLSDAGAGGKKRKSDQPQSEAQRLRTSSSSAAAAAGAGAGAGGGIGGVSDASANTGNEAFDAEMAVEGSTHDAAGNVLLLLTILINF